MSLDVLRSFIRENLLVEALSISKGTRQFIPSLLAYLGYSPRTSNFTLFKQLHEKMVEAGVKPLAAEIAAKLEELYKQTMDANKLSMPVRPPRRPKGSPPNHWRKRTADANIFLSNTDLNETDDIKRVDDVSYYTFWSVENRQGRRVADEFRDRANNDAALVALASQLFDTLKRVASQFKPSSKSEKKPALKLHQRFIARHDVKMMDLQTQKFVKLAQGTVVKVSDEAWVRHVSKGITRQGVEMTVVAGPDEGRTLVVSYPKSLKDFTLEALPPGEDKVPGEALERPEGPQGWERKKEWRDEAGPVRLRRLRALKRDIQWAIQLGYRAGQQKKPSLDLDALSAAYGSALDELSSIVLGYAKGYKAGRDRRPMPTVGTTHLADDTHFSVIDPEDDIVAPY